MRQFAFQNSDSNLIRVHGALDFDERDSGLGVRRLPSWTRMQLPQPLDVMARMPSGVRIQLCTNSPRVQLDVLTTTLRFRDGEPISPVFQLERNGTIQSASTSSGNVIKPNPEAPQGFEVVRGKPESVEFAGLPTDTGFYEIWLPQNAFVELRAIGIEDHAELCPIPQDSRKTWLHYGSSISHCMEANVPSEIWPAVAAREAGLSLMNFGFGGQCHLDQLVARTLRDLDADFISMKVGINIINMNSMKERVFTPALHGFLDTIREKRPKTPITVISPIYCPSAETRPGPTIPDKSGKFRTNEAATTLDGSLSLSRVREIAEEVVSRRRDAGDANLEYFNGLELFDENDRDDLPDDLHPNPAGYLRMGKRFASKHLNAIASRL